MNLSFSAVLWALIFSDLGRATHIRGPFAGCPVHPFYIFSLHNMLFQSLEIKSKRNKLVEKFAWSHIKKHYRLRTKYFQTDFARYLGYLKLQCNSLPIFKKTIVTRVFRATFKMAFIYRELHCAQTVRCGRWTVLILGVRSGINTINTNLI